MSLIQFPNQMSPLIVITRPFPDCSRTAHQAEEKGFETFEEPLGVLKTYALDNADDLPREPGIILTSHRAVPALNDISFNTCPEFYVVGERTALTLRQSGFEDIAAVAANVENLTDWIIKRKERIRQPLLYVRGRDVTTDLKKTLGQHGFEINEHTVYSIDKVSGFSDEFLTRLKSNRPLVVLLTSRRTAETFLHLLKKNKRVIAAPIHTLCFSQNIAQIVEEKAKKLNIELVDYCDEPTEDALIQKLMLMYEEKI